MKRRRGSVPKVDKGSHVSSGSRETSCECCRRRKLRCTSARPACSVCIQSARIKGLDPEHAVCHYSTLSCFSTEYDHKVDQVLVEGRCVVDQGLRQQLAHAIDQLTEDQRNGDHTVKTKEPEVVGQSTSLFEATGLQPWHLERPGPSAGGLCEVEPGLAASSTWVRRSRRPQQQPTPELSPPSSIFKRARVEDSLTPPPTSPAPVALVGVKREEVSEDFEPKCGRAEGTIQEPDPASALPSFSYTQVINPELLSPPISPSATFTASSSSSGTSAGSVLASLDPPRLMVSVDLELAIIKIKESLSQSSDNSSSNSTSSSSRSRSPPSSSCSSSHGSSEWDACAPRLGQCEDFWLGGPLSLEELLEWPALTQGGIA